nr:hypothetical protein [Citrobacter amalonaticus]
MPGLQGIWYDCVFAKVWPDAINAIDFGRINAKAVLEHALSLMRT